MALGLLILGLLRHFQRKQQLLFWKLSEISEQLEKQTDRVQREIPVLPPDLSSLDSPLQCIDAKLLQLDEEAREIRHFLTTLDAEQSFEKLEKLVISVMKLSESCYDQLQQWHQNVPPKIKEIHQFCSSMPSMNKALQQTGLDMQKSFAMAETTSDDLMNQNRESLLLLQNEHKAASEKLIRIEGLLDEVKGSLKQLGVDIHVSRTKGEQRMDNIAKELKDHVGWSHSTFRGLGVMVPQTKAIQDKLLDHDGYLVRANQHDEQMAQNSKAVLEASTNSEDRLVRLEAQVMCIQDSMQELGDQMAQIKESQSLIQDHSQTIGKNAKTSQAHAAGGRIDSQQPHCAESATGSTTGDAATPTSGTHRPAL